MNRVMILLGVLLAVMAISKVGEKNDVSTNFLGAR